MILLKQWMTLTFGTINYSTLTDLYFLQAAMASLSLGSWKTHLLDTRFTVPNESYSLWPNLINFISMTLTIKKLLSLIMKMKLYSIST